MDLKTLVTYIFMVIGILVCIVVTAVALVWVTCFVIRVLVRTFGTKVRSYSEVLAEDIREKSAMKKEFKAQERAALKEQKAELLKVKIESKERINQLKKKKLEQKCREKEKQKSLKMFGTYEEPETSLVESKCNVDDTSAVVDSEIHEEDVDSNEVETLEPAGQETATPIHDADADYFDYTSEFPKSNPDDETATESDNDKSAEDVDQDLDEESDKTENEIDSQSNSDEEASNLSATSEEESSNQTEDIALNQIDEETADTEDSEKSHKADEREREIAKKLSQIRENGEDVQEFIIVDDESETDNFDEKFASLTSIEVDESQEENSKNANAKTSEDDFDFHKYLQEELNKDIADDAESALDEEPVEKQRGKKKKR